MTDPIDPARRPSPLSYPFESKREVVTQSLEKAFIDGVLTQNEYEERLDLAMTARNLPELQVLLEDLPTSHTALVAPPASAPAPLQHTAPPRPSRQAETIFSIMGSNERKGPWNPPSRLNVVTLMGGIQLDFTEALLQPGVTEIQCVAIMGGIEITVPPHIKVENQGTGILGGFSIKLAGSKPAPDAPTLRITGVALMGGVDVRVKNKKDRKLLK